MKKFYKTEYTDGGSMILTLDKDVFLKDRAEKATCRKLKLIKTADRLKNILEGADKLDQWNGFGSGYVYVREEIEELSNLIMDKINE